jgi:hypothetical protein
MLFFEIKRKNSFSKLSFLDEKYSNSVMGANMSFLKKAKKKAEEAAKKGLEVGEKGAKKGVDVGKKAGKKGVKKTKEAVE